MVDEHEDGNGEAPAASAPGPGPTASASVNAGASTSPGATIPPMRDASRELPEFVRQKLEAALPEVLKRTFSAGLGAMFASEEGIRKLAKELNISDLSGYISSTTNTTKDKVMEVVAREVRDALASMNLADEIARILTTLSLEVRTEIRFIPNEARVGNVEPEVKSSVRLRPSARERGVAAAKRFWTRRKGESVARTQGPADANADDAPDVDDDLDDKVP